MKVSTQPMSAFAVYSEKLKQKKKRSKQNDTSRVTKLKKVKNPVASKVKKLEAIQVPSANPVKKPNKSGDKKTWQMKEIGYILQKLAERSTDSSNPRAAALLRSIDEANKKLETGNSVHQEDILANVLVTDMENFKKNGNLKRKKETTNGNSGSFYPTLHSNLEKSIFTGADLTDNGENCNNFESNKKKLSSSVKENTSGSQTNQLKFKKSKALMKGRHASNVLQLKAGTKKNKSQSKPGVKEVEGEQSGGVEVKIRKNINKLETKQDNKIEKTQQKILENVDTTAKKLFEWLILPVFERDFMSDFWEKKPLLIQREGNRKYFSELLSTETIDNMLRENNVCFTKHLDVTSYTDGVRETHNLTGRAQANVVWDFYSNGCSIRLLNPQIFLPKIHTLNATLQEYFGCFVGANVYLTPPNSQGFAPHYDDIEAFVMQIEGKKHWKVYNPRNDAEVLARFSSPNFSQEEIGEPFLDVTLEPGDLLYFPRGFIHQASTVEGEHSLHITLSAYQKTAWVDLFEKVLPIALRRAAESDVEFRRGLPRDYLGLEHRGSPREKQRFVETAQTLMAKLGDYIHLSLGAGVDLMGAQFMHDALPPVLLPGEKENSSVGGGLKLKNGKLEGRVEFQMDTSVKLIRFNVCRLVEEEDEVRLYHCLDNSLEYHGEDPQFLVLPPEGVQVVTLLQGRYPAYVRLRDIPHDDPEALITLISDLWDAGLLSAKDLPVVEES